ncbi:MAG TPA: FAD-binding oxidoreductase [Candidatus Dormibacteraeota bacterium]
MDPAKFTSGAVVARDDFTDDLWMVRIRPEVPISFRAGQYVTVGVEQNGKLLERPYSIVSSPAEPDLELFIELVPPGLLTPHLFPLRVGAEVVLRPRCKGVFLKECPVAAETHLFVATVTGIAPFVSWLRQRRAQEVGGQAAAQEPVVLLQGASLDNEFGYLEEMRALAQDASWFTYIPTVSRPWLCPGWAGETGRVEDVLRKYSDSLGVERGRAGVYLCGHPGMIAGARAIMLRKGIDDKAIREEQYWPEGK